MAENNNKPSKNNSEQAWWQPAMVMFARMSAWIAIPVISALFVGRWLDKRYNTEPILFLVIVGFAFLISIFGLVKIVKEEYGKIEKNNQNIKNLKFKAPNSK
ncbi:MAG: AtpZ/AtpI family protein [Patescibacteria group bacterium]|nr:AtpZ/AtpI family protein [Patescibacteria group bacterium]